MIIISKSSEQKQNTFRLDSSFTVRCLTATTAASLSISIQLRTILHSWLAAAK